MAALFDWDERDDSNLPRGRRMVLVVCCPDCHGLNVQRRTSAGIKAYWKCDDCGGSWTEAAEIGMGGSAKVAE